MILAGYGVQRGKIIGDLSRGPLEDSSFTLNGTAIPFADALPVNLLTGIADPGGQYLSVQSLFPTICAIFGATIPAQQTTEFKAIRAALKTS